MLSRPASRRWLVSTRVTGQTASGGVMACRYILIRLASIPKVREAWPSSRMLVIANILEDGHASRTFGIDANLIKMYLQAMTPPLAVWPVTLVLTNHLRLAGRDNMGNPVYHTP